MTCHPCNDLFCLQPSAIPLTAYGPMAAAAAAAVVRGTCVCVRVCVSDIVRQKNFVLVHILGMVALGKM